MPMAGAMAECQWAPPWEYLPVTGLRMRVDAASRLAAPKRTRTIAHPDGAKIPAVQDDISER